MNDDCHCRWRTATRWAVQLIVIATIGGCFPTNGRPYTATPDTLLTEARQACIRHDASAEHTLLERIVEDYPDSPHARVARERMESGDAETGDCSFRADEVDSPTRPSPDQT